MGNAQSVVQAQRHVHGHLVECAGDAVTPDCHWRAVAQLLMWAPSVVERDDRTPTGSESGRSRIPGTGLSASGRWIDLDHAPGCSEAEPRLSALLTSAARRPRKRAPASSFAVTWREPSPPARVVAP